VAITRETLLKIAAVVNDAATDERTRAVALMRLEEAYERNPELFKTGLSPKAQPKPNFHDVEDVDAAPKQGDSDPEYFSFFDLSDWGRSTKNSDNLVHRLDDGALVTVWVHKRRAGWWGWSILWSDRDDAVFSVGAFPSELAAMRDCWTRAIAPRRRRGRRP
jgi:hypothetical protein